MSMFDKIRDPGFGEKYNSKTKRLINTDGSFNVTRVGEKYHVRDVFQWLINLSWLYFGMLLVLFYISINLIFALLYYVLSPNGLDGIESSISFFTNAFFFSLQTFSTVGYGKMHPIGMMSNAIAAVESLVGLVFYAIVTGVLYSRFSRPKARVAFSKNAIIAPYKEGESLQFRLVNQRSTQLMDIHAKAILMLVDQQHHRQYYRLDLEPSSIQFFPLSWTVVHPITEESPFYNKTPSFYKDTEGEILIFIRGFDETFSQEVHTRTSYLLKDIVCHAKFSPMFETDHDGEILLHLNKINHYHSANK